MATKKPNDISTPSADVLRMREDWGLVEALLEGTAFMRKLGETHLPMWPKEDAEAYAARRKTATLTPAFSRTVKTLAAKPFSKPVTIADETPSGIKEMLDDVDQQGHNIDTVAADQLKIIVAYGCVGILAEHTPRPGGAVTQADEKQAGLRPYAVTVHPMQLLGWRLEVKGGKPQLVQLRIKECVEEPDGEYATVEVEQVRLLTPGAWSIHRKNPQGVWVQHGPGGTNSLSYIPFVLVCADRKGFMLSKPPLIELAHLNVKHWQSQSDQDTLLHVARVPILTAIGVDAKFSLVVGSSAAVRLPMGAELKYCEHTGAALESGAKSLEALVEEMRQAGAELLVLRPGPVTATEVASENAIGMCSLQETSAQLEDAWDQVLQMFADYKALPKGGGVEFFKDFGAATLAEASAQLLVGMATGGSLSKQTLISELKRRGILSAEVEWETEQGLMETEGPPPGADDPTAPLPGDPKALPPVA